MVAPWKQVRAEPPLDPDVETKLLLRRDPDEPTGEMPAANVADLTDEPETPHDATYDDLRELVNAPTSSDREAGSGLRRSCRRRRSLARWPSRRVR